MSEEKQKDGVLSRWSQRKLSGSQENEATSEAVGAEEDVEALEAREAELLANREEAEAIDLDTIDADSDLSLFFKDGVPETLKRQALSRLWRSSPVFANVDGLVDYDDDFADPKLIMKTFTSAYQVGKGYLKEILEETEDAREVASGEGDLNVGEPEVATQELVDPELSETGEANSDHAEFGGDKAGETYPQEPVELEEQEELEPDPVPKVPLRKRLSLDG